MHSRTVALLFIALVSTSAVRAQANPACPVDQVDVLLAGGPIQSTEAALDTVRVYQGRVVNRAAYDLRVGTLRVFHDGMLGQTYTRAADLFDIGGLAPGTVVPATVELAVSGTIAANGCGGSGCYGIIYAQVLGDADHAEQTANLNLFGFNVAPVAFTVTLPVAFEVGQPIRLQFELAGTRTLGGSHTEDAVATYRFNGLPPGAFVTSCQGYVDPVTPTRPQSWGHLKAAYR